MYCGRRRSFEERAGSDGSPVRTAEVDSHDVCGEAPVSAADRTGFLKIAWEGEIFGAALFEALAEKYPEHADKATAAATMEWLNVHNAEDFGHDAGLGVSLEQAEKLARQGTEMVRKKSFEDVAKEAMRETRTPTRCTRSWASTPKTPS